MEAHLPEPTGGDPRVNLAATRLLEKMRWATIGPPYDWTARAYDTDAPRRPVNARWLERWVSTWPRRRERSRLRRRIRRFANYYRAGDALAGHVDDAEVDMSKPIVSVSLGCPCVSPGRDEPGRGADRGVDAIGDAVALTGPSRRCYHGVPRIFVCGRGMRGRTRGGVGVPRVAREPGRVARGAGRGEVHRGRTRQRQRPRGRLG